MYRIKCEKDGKTLYLSTFGTAPFYLWNGNPEHSKIWKTDDIQEAMDMLLYIDNRILQGTLLRQECIDVIDENGNEVYI